MDALSDYELSDLATRVRGAICRVDDEGMVDVPVDYLTDILIALTELMALRATPPAPPEEPTTPER